MDSAGHQGEWFFSIGVRFAYPSPLSFLRAEFSLDYTMAGLLLSAIWVAYALGQFLGDIIGDRFSEGNILMFSTIVSAGTVLVIATAGNLWMLFVGTVVFGSAISLYGPTRFTIFPTPFLN